MPQRVLLNQETHHLDLGEGDWVELKKRWTVADMKAIREAMLKVDWHMEAVAKKQPRNGFRPGHEPGADDAPDPKVEMTQSFNMYESQVVGLRRGIMAWGGAGFCVRANEHFREGVNPVADHAEGFNGCAPIPVTEEAIMALGEPTGALITKQLDALNGDTDLF